MQNTFSEKIPKDKLGKLESLLTSLGFTQEDTKTQYEEYRLRSKSGVAVLYTSGKFLLQGSNITSTINAIQEILRGTKQIGNCIPHIGSDEVGKGDYFGPMITAACYVDEEIVQKLAHLGIMDSKKLSDEKITEIYPEIMQIAPYSTSVLHPTDYNRDYPVAKNVAILLARQHGVVLGDLIEQIGESKRIEKIVVDQFSKSKSRLLNELPISVKVYDIDQFHKGESDIAVAAASVIARGVFLAEWDSMCREYDFEFPKGASNVINPGKRFVEKYGVEELLNVAKISFRTTSQITSQSLF